MSETKRTSQQWVEHVYEVLTVAARVPAGSDMINGLCVEVVNAIADGSIKGWTTAQKICGLIAKARKA